MAVFDNEPEIVATEPENIPDHKAEIAVVKLPAEPLNTPFVSPKTLAKTVPSDVIFPVDVMVPLALIFPEAVM